MKGIEACFQGVLGKDVESKTSRSGKPYAMMNIVVTVGQDDGKDIGQWLRVTVFGDTAQEIAATAKKGSKLYCEGALTLNTLTATDGQQRTGLAVAAWRAIILGQIGQRRPKRAISGSDDTKPADKGAAKKGGREFDDALPF